MKGSDLAMHTRNITDLFSASLAKSNLSAKQQAVLKASLALFASQGFDRTSTKEIAETAQVSEGTVYKQFKTKDGILQALLAPMIRQVMPNVLTEFVNEVGEQDLPDLHTFLTFIVHDRMQFAIANQAQLRVLAATVLRDAALGQELAEQFNRELSGKAARLYATYQANGQLVDWPFNRVLRAIFGTVLSYLLPLIIGEQSSFDLETAVHEAVEFLERGLRA